MGLGTSTVTVPVSRRAVRRAVVLVLVGTALAAEIDLLGPYLGRAAGSLATADRWWVLAAVVAELLSMGAFARVQRRMLSAGGASVPLARMVRLTYAANAVSVTLPAGSLVSTGYVFRRFRSWGATGPAAGFTLLASGLLSTVAFAVLTLSVALVAGDGGTTSVVALVLAAVLVGLAWVTRHVAKVEWALGVADRAVVRVNRLTHRPADTGRAALRGFGAQLGAVRPRARDWWLGLWSAELNWVADLVCLVACCRAVGADGTTLALVMIAYVAGMSAAGVTFLPGGLGVVDAAMIFALTQGGVSTVLATAGVLLYRLISFGLVVAMGWLLWAASWWAERRAAAVRDGVPDGLPDGLPDGVLDEVPARAERPRALVA